MKALLLSLVAVSALAAAVTPAAAQSTWDRGDSRPYDQNRPSDQNRGYDQGRSHDEGRGYDRRHGHDQGHDFRARSQELLARINEAQRDHRVTGVTAQRERRELWQTDRMYLRERESDTLTPAHRADLDRRYDNMVRRFEQELARSEQNRHHGDDHPRR